MIFHDFHPRSKRFKKKKEEKKRKKNTFIDNCDARLRYFAKRRRKKERGARKINGEPKGEEGDERKGEREIFITSHFSNVVAF